MRVLVTGASGKIGRLIVRRLLARGISSFVTRALVRSANAEKKLRQYLGSLSAGLEVVHGDICKKESLDYAFCGIDAVIIATGPCAQVDTASFMAESTLGTLSFGFFAAKPSCWFEDGETPREIDWIGQYNQVDVAKAASIKHVVLLSSMGGTRPHHFLNEKMGYIACWKRRAEHHLVNSGTPFTILRVGGLYGSICGNKPASLDLDVGVDDRAADGSWEFSPLPADEIARLCVECVEEPASLGRSFDVWNRSGQDLEATEQVRISSVADLLAELKGKNGRYKEQPFSPRDIQPKAGLSVSDFMSSLNSQPKCLPVACIECEDRMKCGNRVDVLDAEPPEVMQIFDDPSFLSSRDRSLSGREAKHDERHRYDEHFA